MKTIREKVAEIAHQVWIDWVEYMLNNMTDKNIKRWERQCKTPYSELSEKEKESDRKIARKYLSTISKELIKGLPEEKKRTYGMMGGHLMDKGFNQALNKCKQHTRKVLK